jgi:hypothetical protein
MNENEKIQNQWPAILIFVLAQSPQAVAANSSWPQGGRLGFRCGPGVASHTRGVKDNVGSKELGETPAQSDHDNIRVNASGVFRAIQLRAPVSRCGNHCGESMEGKSR